MMPVWRHVTVSLSINVQYPDVHVSVGLWWCVQCSWLLTADTAGLGRPPPGSTEAGRRQSRWSESWTTGPATLWSLAAVAGAEDVSKGRYLIRTPRTFPWCCLYLNAWNFQSKLVSYLVSSAGEDDTFLTSFQPTREAKASKMVWCLSGIEKLNALTHGLLFELLGEIKEEDHTRANLHYPH